MVRKPLSLIVIICICLVVRPPAARGYTLQYRDSAGVLARRWLTNPILISFSTSLANPPANIKAGSDVSGAARRALRHWTEACNIRFVELTSSIQTLSPQNAGDGANLITVSADNAAAFGDSESPALTRVFYDSTGAIVEGDIALNPHELFSTDGTVGTYDLESTLTHEIGHLIGLDHSAVIAATMQPRQAKNGMYGLPAITQRTLADDDKTAARSLYGPRKGAGSISGKLITNVGGRTETIFGGQVFAEDTANGKVVAGSITLANGDYHLEGLPAGEYRLIAQTLNGPVAAREISPTGGSYVGLVETTPSFRSFVGVGQNLSESTALKRNSAIDLPFFAFSNPPPSLKPELIGMNDELSTTPLPLEPGKSFRIYVGGWGVDQIEADGISLSSRQMRVDAESLRDEYFDVPYSVISFEITLGPDIQAGDYTIRLRSRNGELAYLPGAITIEPPVDER
jgi:Matrixin